MTPFIQQSWSDNTLEPENGLVAAGGEGRGCGEEVGRGGRAYPGGEVTQKVMHARAHLENGGLAGGVSGSTWVTVVSILHCRFTRYHVGNLARGTGTSVSLFL